MLKDAAATAVELHMTSQEEKLTFAIESLDHVEHILEMVQKYANVFERLHLPCSEHCFFSMIMFLLIRLINLLLSGMLTCSREDPSPPSPAA